MKFITLGFGFGVGFAMGLVFISAIYYMISSITTDKDNSDSDNKRSEMQVLTDELTGLQYLRSRTGMVPRMGKDGKQIRIDK